VNKSKLLANYMGAVEGHEKSKPSKGMPEWFLAYADVPAAIPVKPNIKSMKPAKPTIHMVGQQA